ncbi:MAG: hypothetical protein FJ368_01385, partial [Pelagibacterales bacterium]|nr:hypothetical protein [Pelagibacterales bacterium]
MPQDKIQKFSALSKARIEEIIDRCKEKNITKWLAPIARKSQEILTSTEYAHLKDLGQNLDVGKLNDNITEIASFLKDCRLIGAENNKEEVIHAGNYVIGAEGVALINEYMATKPNNVGSHEVKIIKNQDLYGEENSQQTPNVLKQQKAIHSSFAKTLTDDLIEAQQTGQEFNKTYVIEAFGTTGGNHFFTVTVRKNPDETSPLIDFFDPSTGLLRGNIETLQNSIATGWTSQIAVNATLTKALRDAGLEFDLSKYFNNLEPMQMQGSSNCSVFSYEKAYMTANLSRQEHEALLREHYKFESPFGGKTEVEVDINLVDESTSGKVERPKLNMPAQYMAMTHFNNNAEKYLQAMQQLVHKRKDRTTESEEPISETEESIKERRDRYLTAHERTSIDKDTQEVKTETFFTNELITQKHFRQKYGHLFEIVTHPKFAELGQLFSEQQLLSEESLKDSVYFPAYSAKEKPQNFMAEVIVNGAKMSDAEKEQGHQDVRGLNKILPFPIKVVSAEYKTEE